MFMKFLGVYGIWRQGIIYYLGLIRIRIWVQDQFFHFSSIGVLDINRINSKSC